MSFDVTTPNSDGALAENAVPVIALGFDGLPTGSPVSKAVTQRKGQRANWCWAGTTDPSATIRIKTYYVHPKHPAPWQTAEGIYLWASPSLETYGNDVNLRPAKAMGHQDVPNCRPATG